jgi:hypothetical protein
VVGGVTVRHVQHAHLCITPVIYHRRSHPLTHWSTRGCCCTLEAMGPWSLGSSSIQTGWSGCQVRPISRPKGSWRNLEMACVEEHAHIVGLLRTIILCCTVGPMQMDQKRPARHGVGITLTPFLRSAKGSAALLIFGSKSVNRVLGS